MAFNKGDKVYLIPSGRKAVIKDFEAAFEVTVADPAGQAAKRVYQAAWVYQNANPNSTIGYPTAEMTRSRIVFVWRMLKARLMAAWSGFKNPQFKIS